MGALLPTLPSVMKRKKEKPPLKLDISNNFQAPPKDYKRLDLKELKHYNAEADEVLMNGVLEQTPGKDRPTVMRLVSKALKPGGVARCQFADWTSAASVMSPFSEWPPLCKESFGFFSKSVRDASKYTNPVLNGIDFDLTFAPIISEKYKTRPEQFLNFATEHYLEFTKGYLVTMTKKG